MGLISKHTHLWATLSYSCRVGRLLARYAPADQLTFNSSSWICFSFFKLQLLAQNNAQAYRLTGVYRYHGRHSPPVNSPPLLATNLSLSLNYLLIMHLSPDETLAMSYIYRNRYWRFQESSEIPDPLDSYVRHSSCSIIISPYLSARGLPS